MLPSPSRSNIFIEISGKSATWTKLLIQLRLIYLGEFLFVTQTSSPPIPYFNVVKNHPISFGNLPCQLNMEWGRGSLNFEGNNVVASLRIYNGRETNLLLRGEQSQRVMSQIVAQPRVDLAPLRA